MTLSRAMRAYPSTPQRMVRLSAVMATGWAGRNQTERLELRAARRASGVADVPATTQETHGVNGQTSYSLIPTFLDFFRL